MEKTYLTISEFAGLRHVSIGSLRYYEKLRILVPARVDPQTGYRYYLPEQLLTLDSILTCVALGIPLRELKNYTEADGTLDQKSILMRGRQVMQDKIAEMQIKLRLTQYNLDRIEENQRFNGQEGLYTRTIEARSFIAEPIPGSWPGLPKKGEDKPMALFQSAEDAGMVPTLPAGILIRCDSTPAQLYYYFQVLHPDPADERIIHIPAGEFTCLQADLTPQTDLEALLRRSFAGNPSQWLIISNMLLGKVYLDSMHTEIQMAKA